MTGSLWISSILYALMDSNFDNIKKNIEEVKKIFTESDQVIHRISYYFDANEQDVWCKTTYFEFYNSKGEMLYTYNKATQWIGRSTSRAKEHYEETKKRFPLAVVEFEESKFAEKYP